MKTLIALTSALYAFLSANLLAGDESPQLPFKNAVSAERLDSLRGGFATDDGFKISLGIERLTFINDELVSTTTLTIPDLTRFNAGNLQLRGPSVALIQNGPGNGIDPAVLQNIGPGMATIIQNSLDNQVIRGMTIINTQISGVGSLGTAELLRGIGR